MKIAIIGCGVDGSNVLRSLIDHPNLDKEDEIHVFEPRDLLGAGLPYEPDYETKMLNIGPEEMSVEPDKDLDFVDWLDENKEEPRNHEGIVNRVYFGEYINDRFQAYYDHDQVRIHKTAVEDVRVLEDEDHDPTTSPGHIFQYKIMMEGTWLNDTFDAVFFTIGHPEYNDFYDLMGKENYIQNPYPMKDKLSSLQKDQKVGAIGSGATGIDLFRHLTSHFEFDTPPTIYIRNQPFRIVYIPLDEENKDFTFSFDQKWIDEQRAENEGYVPLDNVIAQIRSDLEVHKVSLEDVYNRYQAKTRQVQEHALETNDQELALVEKYIDRFVPYWADILRYMTGLDQDRYIEDYDGKLSFFRGFVPTNTIRWILDETKKGKFRIVSGLTEIEENKDGGFTLTADNTEEVDVLINATGFDQNIDHAVKTTPLIRNLYDGGIIRKDVGDKWVLVDWPQCRLMNKRYGIMDNAFMLGVWIGGTHHQNNDARPNMKQARYVANWYMDHIKNK